MESGVAQMSLAVHYPGMIRKLGKFNQHICPPLNNVWCADCEKHELSKTNLRASPASPLGWECLVPVQKIVWSCLDKEISVTAVWGFNGWKYGWLFLAKDKCLKSSQPGKWWSRSLGNTKKIRLRIRLRMDEKYCQSFLPWQNDKQGQLGYILSHIKGQETSWVSSWFHGWKDWPSFCHEKFSLNDIEIKWCPKSEEWVLWLQSRLECPYQCRVSLWAGLSTLAAVAISIQWQHKCQQLQRWSLHLAQLDLQLQATKDDCSRIWCFGIVIIEQ